MIRLRGAWTGLLATAVLAASLVACSSDRSLTAAQYRRAVRKECVALRRDTAALPSPEPTATDRFVHAGRQGLALERAALAKIRALDAPPADQRAVRRWLALVGAGLDATDASLTAQDAGDFVEARAANGRGLRSITDADAIARSLDLDDCTTPALG